MVLPALASWNHCVKSKPASALLAQNGGTLDHEGAVAIAEHLVVLRPQLAPVANAAISRSISAEQFMALIEARS